MTTLSENITSIPAVIMGVAVELYTLPNGEQIVCAPYKGFVDDLTKVLAFAEAPFQHTCVNCGVETLVAKKITTTSGITTTETSNLNRNGRWRDL